MSIRSYPREVPSRLDDPSDYSLIADLLPLVDSGQLYKAVTATRQCGSAVPGDDGMKIHTHTLADPGGVTARSIRAGDPLGRQWFGACAANMRAEYTNQYVGRSDVDKQRYKLVMQRAVHRCMFDCLVGDVPAQLALLSCWIQEDHVYGSISDHWLDLHRKIAIHLFCSLYHSGAKVTKKSGCAFTNADFGLAVSAILHHSYFNLVDLMDISALCYRSVELFPAAENSFNNQMITAKTSLRTQVLQALKRSTLCSETVRFAIATSPTGYINLFNHHVFQEPAICSQLLGIGAALPMSYWMHITPIADKSNENVCSAADDTDEIPVKDFRVFADTLRDAWVFLLKLKTSIRSGRPWPCPAKSSRQLYRILRHYIAVDRWILKQWVHHAEGPVRLLVHDVVCHVSTFLYGDHTFPHDFFQKTFSLTRAKV